MNIWKPGQGEQFRNSDACKGEEFNADTIDACNIARIAINGRYPESGWLYNTEVHEMVVVEDGSGELLQKAQVPTPLAKGDIVHVAPLERIAWSGAMTIVMVCTPKFTVEQYRTEDGDE